MCINLFVVDLVFRVNMLLITLFSVIWVLVGERVRRRESTIVLVFPSLTQIINKNLLHKSSSRQLTAEYTSSLYPN